MKTKRTCFWGNCHLCAEMETCALPENTTKSKGWVISDEDIADRFLYSKFRSRLSTKKISPKKLSEETGIEVKRIQEFKKIPPTLEEFREIVPLLNESPSYFLAQELTARTKNTRKNVNSILSEREISRKKFAKMAGMSFGDLLTRLNCRTKNIGAGTIRRFARALGVTPEELEEE